MNKMDTFLQLEDIYKDIIQKGNYEEAVEKITGGLKINSLVNYYVNVVQEFVDEDMAIVDIIIRILQEIYNNSDVISPISDEDYDKLYELNRDINRDEIVGATVGSRDGKIISAHKYPDLRGTLDKIHFITNDEKKPGEKRKSLEDWVKSVMNELEIPYNVLSEIVIELFPKWDGISGIFECWDDGETEKVLKRGDTTRNEAEEMTSMFKGVTNMADYNPWKDVPFGLKTEIVMTRFDFKRLCDKYGEFKSPRSAVSSIINSKDLDKKYLEFLTIIPLQVQNFETKEIGTVMAAIEDYPCAVAKLTDYDSIKDSIKKLVKEVDDSYGIDIDGIVIRIANLKLQQRLGRDNNINNYEVAYKLPPEQKKTILKDVEMSVGVLGAVTPVAKIEPIKLKGNTISNISLGSIDRFESLGLRQGDEVIIKYDVIPYLEVDGTCMRGNGEIFTTPTECPYCKERLVKQPVLRCVNENCDSRVVGKIMNYTTKMSIPNISIGTITTLFKEGLLKSIEDLYRLEDKEREIVQLEGFGSKSFSKIIDGINSRKEVYDYEMIGSIGIPDVGRKMFKKILDIYNIDELIEICLKGKADKLTSIAGIKDRTAKKISLGVIANFNLIKFLRSQLNVKRDIRKYTIKVAFTKVRDKDFEQYLDSKDVLVMDSYNKNVDVLIVPTLATSSTKVDKARKDGKEIWDIATAYKNFGYTKQEG